MFNDIGKKIMNYMKTIYVIAIICLIISLIFDIISIASMYSSQLMAKYGANDAAAPILSSIFSHFLTAAGIYVGCWVLYAFGQLVDDVHEMKLKNDKKNVSCSNDYARSTSEKIASQYGRNGNTQPKINVVRSVEKTGTMKTKENPHLPTENWKCYYCGTENVFSMRICSCCGQWLCPECGRQNSVSNDRCRGCGTIKGNNVDGSVTLQQTKKAQKAESVPVNPASKDSKEDSKSKGSESKEVPQLVNENHWQCSCGRTNPYYVVTCVCGKKKDKVE